MTLSCPRGHTQRQQIELGTQQHRFNGAGCPQVRFAAELSVLRKPPSLRTEEELRMLLAMSRDNNLKFVTDLSAKEQKKCASRPPCACLLACPLPVALCLCPGPQLPIARPHSAAAAAVARRRCEWSLRQPVAM